ncbi:MAG: O-antigen ligase [Rhizobiaceae bacterium]
MSLAHDHSGGRVWHQPVAQPRTSYWPAALILTIVFITFRPLSDPDPTSGAQGGGDLVNQLGFGVLGVICLYLLAKNACRNTLAALSNPLWLMVLPVLALSVVSADLPAAAMRAMIFSLIVVLAAATAMSQPRNMSEMVSALSFATGSTLLFCYVAVFAYPDLGVHPAEGVEAVHAGLWRGVYDHKNVASYVMGGLALFGWFVARNGKPVVGFSIIIAATVFVIQAGSKTVLGILPASILCVAVAQWISWRPLKALAVLSPVIVLTTTTLGSVVFPSILLEIQSYFPGLTYTGRTDIWIFGLNSLAESPWFGYGFESFWNTPRVLNAVQPINLDWDVRGTVHGHNSWLDATLAFGIPGTILLVLVLVVLPVRDYVVVANRGNAGKLAHLFITLWLFTSLGANLESFFFRRADPVWFCMLIAIVGLRLTAHMSRQHTSAPMPR